MYPESVTVYGEAEPDNVPDHRFPIEDPAGRGREVDQLLIADEPAVTVTATWKPPSQLLATVSAALLSGAAYPVADALI